MAGRGGARSGAGRKKSSSASKTKIRLAAATQGLADGVSPLDVMLSAMRVAHDAGELAKAANYASLAAPYVHPRLASVNATATIKATLTLINEFPDG